MRQFLFFEIVNRFYKEKKLKFNLLFILSLFAGLFEYMGLILIFQFVLFLSSPTSKYCELITQFFKNNFNITDFSKISLIMGITIAAIYILKNIYMLIFTRIINGALEDLSTKITLKLIKNLLFQDYIKTSKITPEEKLNILSKNEYIIWQYCYKFINLISNCAIAIILIAYLFIKFTLSAIIAVSFISILALIEYYYLKKNSTYQNKHFSCCFDELNSKLIKTVNLIKEIKINNKYDEFTKNIETSSKEYAKLNKDRTFCSIFHIYFTEISVMLAFVLVLGSLFYTTNFNNQLLITTITTICVIILRLTPVINRAQSCLYSINSNRAFVYELVEFDKKFENIEFKVIEEKLEFNSDIELKNVYFSYDEKDGLKDINLKIKKNEFIGIVGKSGCGKTTLSLILSGLIKPQKGEVIIDNVALKKEDYQKWQNNISLLTQDFDFLFDETKNISKDYIEKLELNNINSNLNNLSAGEKQRIALANILSQGKNILILDEITSSLDVLAEEKINEILEELKGKKTIISIAHRLNILKHCDKIIYMDEGKIIDINSFKALSDKYQEFKKIIELSKIELN
ncbi:MAG: ATP-binding cassette domain-containing protein [Candidatus Gastranaerophilales bacterium]|nr:ATP-binding cassette domain-containing protein [Candidatus Gastranaerophilales bacterium]